VGYARVSTKQQDLSPAVLSLDGWGDLIFVLALCALALALYVGRPEEPATTVLLVGDAGLANSTVIVVAGNHTAGFWPTRGDMVTSFAAGVGHWTAAGIRRAPILDLRCCSLMMASWW
jgi:hypothetical protein